MSSGNGKNIIDKILSDAKAEADSITAQAREKADAMLLSAKQKADKEKAALYELSKAEAEKAKAKEISAAEMKAKKMVLSKKQECIEAVIEDARKKLAGLTDDEYKVIMKAMIKNAPKGEIILSKKDKEKLAKEIRGMGMEVSDEVRGTDGGFIVKDVDIEYNYSFESIISVEKETIEQIAAGILFG